MGKKGAQVRNKLTASPTNASSDGEVGSPALIHYHTYLATSDPRACLLMSTTFRVARLKEDAF